MYKLGGDCIFQAENQKLMQSGKILGSIYGFLIIFFAVLFFLGSIAYSSLPQTAAERSLILILSVGALILIMGTELERVLFNSGVIVQKTENQLETVKCNVV